MESLLGKILKNKYCITHQLAQKNYWTTYLAEDRFSTDKPYCVIKQLQLPREGESFNSQAWLDLRENLTLEIMKLKQVDHYPQITDIRDFFIIEKDFYFVREYITGETLAEEITRHTLTEEEVIFLLKNTLQCLDFIHQKNIIHGNLQPSNIIFSQEARQIFLTDFVQIKERSLNQNLQLQFLNSEYLERQEFIAPESQICSLTNQNSSLLSREEGKNGNLGQNNQNHLEVTYQQDKPIFASDIYALGKIAIYALSGKKNNKVEINNLDNLARSAIKDLKSHQEISISSKLANILNKMTCDRYQDRYQSAKEVLHDLEEEENVVVFPPAFDDDFSKVDDLANGKQDYPDKQKKQTNKLNLFGSKLWRILAIPLLVIISILGILVYQINRYRNFVEYTNDNYNLSFKYPQDWSLEELEDPITGEIAVLSAPLEDGFDLFQEKIYLSVDELPEEVNSLDLYSQTMFKKIQSQLAPNTTIYQGNIDKVDENEARSLVYVRKEGTRSLQQMEIFTVKGNRAYIITYIAEDIKYQEFLKITKKILGSLQIRNEEEKK